ncbi:MAG: RimK family alpha-L-glutamate ligase [Lachnospirales bacterium]
MKGILIYNKEDYELNVTFGKWLIDEFGALGVELKVVFTENIYNMDFDFAINRSRNIDISLLCQLNNIPVFNNSQITLLGNNKLMAYNYAKILGLNILPVLLKDEEQMIAKPNHGHGGEGIRLVNKINHGLIYQQYKKIIGDVRFYIINNELIASVIRTNSNSIVSNFSKGGNVEVYKPTGDELAILNTFKSQLDIDYCGIDFLKTEDDFYFNEIEDVVGSRMLSHLKMNNTGTLFAKHIYNKLNTRLNIYNETKK